MYYLENPRHTQSMVAYNDFDWVFLEILVGNRIVGMFLTPPIIVGYMIAYMYLDEELSILCLWWFSISWYWLFMNNCKISDPVTFFTNHKYKVFPGLFLIFFLIFLLFYGGLGFWPKGLELGFSVDEISSWWCFGPMVWWGLPSFTFGWGFKYEHIRITLGKNSANHKDIVGLNHKGISWIWSSLFTIP